MRAGTKPALRPESVDILGKAFRVEHIVGGALDDDDMGDCNYDTQVISIDAEVPLGNAQDTLLHECIHALDHQVKIKLREDQVVKLATVLLTWMKSNPKTVRYLMRKS